MLTLLAAENKDQKKEDEPLYDLSMTWNLYKTWDVYKTCDLSMTCK